MELAIIDLGTNSVRFDIYSVAPDGRITVAHREKLMVRLGDKLFLQGVLDPEAKDRCLAAFYSFANTLRARDVTRVRAVATSAVREAADGDSFAAIIEQQSGIPLQVLSGQEEAYYIAKGILARDRKLPKECVLIDIGGGSTEISLIINGRVDRAVSLPLGALRLNQLFLSTIPPQQGAAQRLRVFCREEISDAVGNWPKSSIAVGSSGSARTLAEVGALWPGRASNPLSLHTLADMNKTVETMSAKEIIALSGMEPKRVDIVLAGGLLLEELMARLGAVHLQVTEFSLRDGMLVEELGEEHSSPHP